MNRLFFALFGGGLLWLGNAIAWAQEAPEAAPLSAPEPPTRPEPGAGPGAFGGMMGGGMGNNAPGYDALWAPLQPVRNQPTDLGFVRQGLSLGAPVWRDAGDMLLARFSIRHTQFQTDALLPDSRRPFPNQLWNINFGGNYRHDLGDGWSAMLIGGIGSASDKPFRSIREVNATLGGMVRFPAANDRDTWTLGAFYMAGGAVDFPLPIIAYGWNYSEQLQVNIGIPFALTWRPIDDWTLNLSYMPLLNINARLTYQYQPGLQLYAAYEFFNEAYFLADRQVRNDRFFILEQRVYTGLRADLADHLALELQAGYLFGRGFGEGDNPWRSLQDRVDVRPGAFVSASFRLRF
ncbi:MAG: DUF6268 family outer membrane beta-barrel protein, partial [Gemmataceae bacterium]